MEAPVPASSLIHSATLVSAGIFLILRFHPIFEHSTISIYILLLVGSTTAAYGGLVAAYVSDIKKILAYSTISHCGFLMVLCAVKTNEYTLLYLYVHGFFKAAVFMCVGNVIRISKGYQDFRRMGNFFKYLPFECFVSFICLMNLAGLPFSLGFMIKHFLFITNSKSIFTYIVLFNIVIGALAGLFYSYRLYYNVFFDFKKGKKIVYNYLNRNENSSIFYSNTSLASNIAIAGLVIVSYIIIIFLFINLLNKNDSYSDFSNLIININIFKLNFNSLPELYTLAYLNIIVLIIILFLLTLS
jgi:NADH-quinone oxidoreductase subunit L